MAVDLFAPLGLAFALTVPLIILMWLLRRRRQDREVSSTYLWQQVLRDVRANAPWQRLKLHLLLFLQMLVALGLALALARPYLPAVIGERVHLLLLVDVSGSMQTAAANGGSRFQAALQQAEALVGSLGARDRMSIVGVGRLPRIVAAEATPTRARAALAGLVVSNEVADWPQALSFAASLARGEKGLRAVILTDAPPAPGSLEGLGVRVDLVAVGEAGPPNLGIERLALRTGEAGSAALVRVVNYGSTEIGGSLSFYGDGQLLDVRRISAAPGKAAEVTLAELPRAARVFSARLEAAGDALAADNAAWAVAGTVRQVRALLVTRSNLFLERALALRGGLEVVRTTPENYAPGPYNLYVFDGWLPADLPRAAILAVAPPVGDQILTVGGSTPVTAVRAGAEARELLAFVPLEDVHVARARRLEVPDWGRVVLESAETPLLVAGQADGRPIAVVSFDLHDSDLPLRLGFPLLIQNLVSWLAPPDPVPPAVAPGEPVPLALDPAVAEAVVITPGGRREVVAPPLPAPPWSQTGELGVYTVVQRLPAGERESRFVVNFPALESSGLPTQLAPVGGSEVGGRLPADIANREVWSWVAWAALLLLAAEWWVYRRTA